MLHHMLHDCCGGHVAGDSLDAALRGTFHLIHEGLQELFPINSRRSQRLIIVVVGVVLLLLIFRVFDALRQLLRQRLRRVESH